MYGRISFGADFGVFETINAQKILLSLCLVMHFLFLRGDLAHAQGLIGAPVKIQQDHGPTPPYPYPENRARLQFSVPKHPDAHDLIDIRYSISADGNIYDLHLVRSSGVDEFDFDCLTALLGSLPYPKSLPPVQTKDVSFGLASGDCGKTNNDILRLKNQSSRHQFRCDNVLYADQFFLINTIPIDVYFRYPKLFSVDQLINSKNLVAIRKSWFDASNEPTFEKILSNQKFREYFERWSVFFDTHPSVTKKEIEEFSKKLEADYPIMLWSPSRSSTK